MPVKAPDPIPPAQPVRISALAQLARKPSWTHELYHSTNCHRLIWITRGQGHITFGAQIFAYAPNSVIFLPAKTMHCFDLKPNVFGTLMEVENSPIVEMPDHAMHLRVRDALEQGKFVGLVENLQREMAQALPLQTRASQFHAGLLGVWLERSSNAVGRPRLDATRRLVAKYMELVEERFNTGWIIQDYARELDVTTTHLTRCCRVCLGTSALIVLNQRILQEARSLLSLTKITIKDVASMLGFSSAAYFTRSFQYETGQSPSAFRKASRSV